MQNQSQISTPEGQLNQTPQEMQLRTDVVKKLSPEELARFKAEQLSGPNNAESIEAARENLRAVSTEIPVNVTAAQPEIKVAAEPLIAKDVMGEVEPVLAVEKLDGVLESGPAEYANAVTALREKFREQSGYQEDPAEVKKAA